MNIKKFRSRINEDLNGALLQPSSNAAEEAKRMGLKYVGFGRYEDPRTQQVTHIVQNDRLVPFKAAVRTGSYKQQNSDDMGNFSKAIAPVTEKIAEMLKSSFDPSSYSDQELDAVQDYTEEGFFDINQKLYSLPVGISADDIEPEYDGDRTYEKIQALDSMMAKSSAPIDFITYTSLSKEYSLDDFKPGTTFQFKGFRSTSINPYTGIDYNPRSTATSNRVIYALQIKIPKGSRGAYVDDISANPGEHEYILPRGSMIKVNGGPQKIVGSNAQWNINNQEIYFFDCELVG
jgi:hypothetical protein